jgi:WD40 repeat protein
LANDKLLVFDALTGRLLDAKQLPANTFTPSVDAVSAQSLVAADDGGADIELLDVRTGRQQGPTLHVTGTRVDVVRFSQDGGRLVATSDDGGIRVWNTADGTELATMRGLSSDSGATCLEPTCTRLLGDNADHAALWDVDQPVAGGPSVADEASLMLPIGGGRFAVAATDGFLRFYDSDLKPVGRPLEVGIFDYHGGGAVDPANTTVVVAGVDAPLDGSHPNARAAAVAVDLATLKITHTWHLSGYPYITAAAISPNGRRIALGGGGRVEMFDLRSGAQIVEPFTVDSHSTGVVLWSSDSAHLYSGGQDGVLKRWTIDATAQLTRKVTLATDAFIGDAVSQGQQLAVASEDGYVRIVDARTLKVVKAYQSGGTQLQTVALDPAGDRVYATSRDGTLRIWDRATGRSVGPPLSGFESIGERLIATSTRTLFSAEGIGMLRWDLGPATLVDRECALAGRNLTRAEWLLYLPDDPYRKTCDQYAKGR